MTRFQLKFRLKHTQKLLDVLQTEQYHVSDHDSVLTNTIDELINMLCEQRYQLNIALDAL